MPLPPNGAHARGAPPTPRDRLVLAAGGMAPGGGPPGRVRVTVEFLDRGETVTVDSEGSGPLPALVGPTPAALLVPAVRPPADLRPHFLTATGRLIGRSVVARGPAAAKVIYADVAAHVSRTEFYVLLANMEERGLIESGRAGHRVAVPWLGWFLG